MDLTYVGINHLFLFTCVRVAFEIRSAVNNEIFINDIKNIFLNNLYRREFYIVIYIFGRIKLMGDFIQMIEVDKNFKNYRHDNFINKNGYLITQDRILGSYCSTIKDINYMCKVKLNDGLYYFYRNN